VIDAAHGPAQQDPAIELLGQAEGDLLRARGKQPSLRLSQIGQAPGRAYVEEQPQKRGLLRLEGET